MGLGGPEVRLEEENATSESRVAMVARVARPRHRFGRPELEGEADSGGPLSATPEWRGLARAVPTWAEREQAGQQAEFPGRS